MKDISEHDRKILALIDEHENARREPYLEKIRKQNLSTEQLMIKLADALCALDTKNKRNAGRKTTILREFAFLILSESEDSTGLIKNPTELEKQLEELRKTILKKFQEGIAAYNESNKYSVSAQLTSDKIPSEFKSPVKYRSVIYWINEFKKIKRENPILLDINRLRLNTLFR